MELTENMEEFLNDLIGKRMEQVYQEKDGEQYDPFNEELELKVQKIIRKLPPKQGKVIFDYMTEISNNNSDLNEFYYRMGLRDQCIIICPVIAYISLDNEIILYSYLNVICCF